MAAAESLVAHVPFLLATQQSAAQQIDFSELPVQERGDAYLVPSARLPRQSISPCLPCSLELKRMSNVHQQLVCAGLQLPPGTGLLLMPAPLQKSQLRALVPDQVPSLLPFPRGGAAVAPSRWAKLAGWEPQAGVHPAAALLVPAVLEATRNKARASNTVVSSLSGSARDARRYSLL